MDDRYLVTIIQYLVKLLEKQGGESGSSVSDKLDEVIEAVSNIKISAESVNLNTDELEAKLDNVNTNIQNLIQALNNGISTINEKQDSILNAINVCVSRLDSIKTNTNSISTINSKVEEIKTKQDTTNTKLNNVLGRFKYLNPENIMAVSPGNSILAEPAVLFNKTNENITVTVIPADSTMETSVILTPGWNPIVVKSIKGATANTLLYGY